MKITSIVYTNIAKMDNNVLLKISITQKNLSKFATLPVCQCVYILDVLNSLTLMSLFSLPVYYFRKLQRLYQIDT